MSTKEDILRDKLIVIARGVSEQDALKLAEALHEGGINCMEITIDQKSTDGNLNTLHSIEKIAKEMQGVMHIGAGTVMTVEQVHAAADAGAEYMISPNVSRAVIEETKRLNLLSMPGALTPSEIATAYEYGADFVKVFPISNLGAGYLKAIKAPLSHIPLLAVGGVRPENIQDYWQAGACGFGVGGNLVNRDWIREGRFADITAEAKRFCAALNG